VLLPLAPPPVLLALLVVPCGAPVLELDDELQAVATTTVKPMAALASCQDLFI
jgi:hypothetical protein